MSEERFRFAYFPGCSLESSAKEFDESTREVCEALGVELVEIPDWNCCGATSAHSLDRALSLALPTRNLRLADQMGLDLLAPCAACFSREKLAVLKLAEEGSPLSITARHLIEVLTNPPILERIKGAVKREPSLKVVCYYGCLLARPPELVDFDDPENPQMMDDIVRAIGCEPVDWSFKTDCCGAGLSIARTDVVLKLVGRLIEMAHEAGADCIAVACPMCHSNLDGRQKGAVKRFGGQTMPVLYITELIGMALGLEPQKWFKKHTVPVRF
jgi:heterodisulfide reductase subunit B